MPPGMCADCRAGPICTAVPISRDCGCVFKLVGNHAPSVMVDGEDSEIKLTGWKHSANGTAVGARRMLTSAQCRRGSLLGERRGRQKAKPNKTLEQKGQGNGGQAGALRWSSITNRVLATSICFPRWQP